MISTEIGTIKCCFCSSKIQMIPAFQSSLTLPIKQTDRSGQSLIQDVLQCTYRHFLEIVAPHWGSRLHIYWYNLPSAVWVISSNCSICRKKGFHGNWELATEGWTAVGWPQVLRNWHPVIDPPITGRIRYDTSDHIHWPVAEGLEFFQHLFLQVVPGPRVRTTFLWNNVGEGEGGFAVFFCLLMHARIEMTFSEAGVFVIIKHRLALYHILIHFFHRFKGFHVWRGPGKCQLQDRRRKKKC